MLIWGNSREREPLTDISCYNLVADGRGLEYGGGKLWGDAKKFQLFWRSARIEENKYSGDLAFVIGS
ncbi:MAG: hypothetical protein Fur0025_12410 [Oscillatoriaceae cyanobacterium]